MDCPSCKYGDTEILETRADKDKIKRRRQCLRCGFRVTTEEQIKPPKRKKDVYYDIR
jgi:transcriptional repressor NrdR